MLRMAVFCVFILGCFTRHRRLIQKSPSAETGVDEFSLSSPT